MKIKEAVIDRCKCCGKTNKIVSNEVYGCDVCKKAINQDKPDREYLRFTIHFHEKTAERKEVCSWICASKLIKSLVKKKAVGWFISLPFVSSDNYAKGCTLKDFLKILK